MSATADPSCSELSEALQRNAKHEARLSNISHLCSFAACENKSRSFARAQDDKRAGVFGRQSFGFKTSSFDYNRRTLIDHFEQFDYVLVAHPHAAMARSRADFVLMFGAMNVHVPVAGIHILLVKSV